MQLGTALIAFWVHLVPDSDLPTKDVPHEAVATFSFNTCLEFQVLIPKETV